MIGAEEKDNSHRETASRPVLEHFEANIRNAAEFCKKAWDRASENHLFTYGEQWSDKDLRRRNSTDRPSFTMNDVILAVNAVAGREATARFEHTYLPREDDDAGWADVCREFVRWLRNQSRAEHVESDAFRDLQIEAYSWIWWDQVYDNGDVNGRTRVRKLPIWTMLWDPGAAEQDLTDRAWDACGVWISLDEYLMMFPDQKARAEAKRHLLSDMSGFVDASKTSGGPPGSTTHRWPWLHRVGRGYYEPKRKEVFLADYQWREREGWYSVPVPPATSKHPAYNDADHQAAMEAFQAAVAEYESANQEYQAAMEAYPQQAADAQAQGQPPPEQPQPPEPPQPPVVPGWEEREMVAFSRDELDAFMPELLVAMDQLRQQDPSVPAEPDILGPQDNLYRWAYRRAVIVGGKVIKEWRMEHGFQRTCMTAWPLKQPEGTRMYCLVDLMRSPQEFKNYIYSLGVALLQRSNKGGMVVKKGFFADIAEARKQLSSPYPMIEAAEGASLDGTQMMNIPIEGFPNGLGEWLSNADQATWRPTGLNPGTLGGMQDPRRVASKVFQSLADAVTQTMSWIFDSHRLYRQLTGELLLRYMAQYYDPKLIRRVVGQKVMEKVSDPKKWADFTRFDTIIEETATTRSQQEAVWEYFSNQGTAEKLLGMGLMKPQMFVKLLPDSWIKDVDRKEWLAFLDEKEQQAKAAPPAPAG